jgi:hypothetical protein
MARKYLERGNMKKYKLLVVLMLLVAVAGCALVEPKVNKDGVTYTDMENYLKTAGGVLQSAGAFIPGYGTILAGLGGLLSVIAGSITSVVMVRKRGNTLDTVIKGVEEASITFDKMSEQIKLNLKPEDYAKILPIIEQATSIKDTIKKIADLLGTESYLHSRVKSIG